MRISDWSSDVCSSDLNCSGKHAGFLAYCAQHGLTRHNYLSADHPLQAAVRGDLAQACAIPRSEEHMAELQSLMRISYAVFCLKKKNNNIQESFESTHYDTHRKNITIHTTTSNQ